jgi:hypothetical protein
MAAGRVHKIVTAHLRTSPILLATLASSLSLLALGCDGAVRYIGTDCVPSGTDRELQAAVDQRSTVLLCPRALFTLAAPLVLRPGVSLQTAGLPSAADDMATVKLAATFQSQGGAAVVGSGNDIHLAAVRFDGNRRELGPRDPVGLIELGPGQGYRVEGCALADAVGWTHLHLLEPCEGATITDNVVESAPRPHHDALHLSDGMSLSCARTTIERNRITDVSGVGIVYFGGPGSVIRDNVVVEATTSALSGINLGDAVVADHTGVLVEGNRISAIGPRYMHVGIAVGLHVYGKTATISGVTVRANQIEGMSRYGLAVDGCLGCTVSDNQVGGWHPAPPLDGCPPPAAYAAAVTVAHAGGTLQAGFADQKIDSCLGDPDLLGPSYRAFAGNAPFPEYLAFEVQVFSMRLEQGLDAAAMLHDEWNDLAARATTICPLGDMTGQQAVWRRLADAQYGAGLSPAEADARVRADLAAAPAGTPCAQPGP